jgi:hypothetical protein
MSMSMPELQRSLRSLRLSSMIATLEARALRGRAARDELPRGLFLARAG